MEIEEISLEISSENEKTKSSVWGSHVNRHENKVKSSTEKSSCVSYNLTGKTATRTSLKKRSKKCSYITESLNFNRGDAELSKERDLEREKRDIIQSNRPEADYQSLLSVDIPLPKTCKRKTIESDWLFNFKESPLEKENITANPVINSLCEERSEDHQIKKPVFKDNFRKINLKKRSYVKFKKNFGRKRNWQEVKRKANMKEENKKKVSTVKKSIVKVQRDFPTPTTLKTLASSLSISSKKLYFDSLSENDQDKLLNDTLKLFNHSSFREGQKSAIVRILSGLSTLFVCATGSGKSLTYQLPAYLKAVNEAHITIVVSPLISLMEDQMNQLPSFIKGACLSHVTNINRELRQKLHILFITPETLTSENSVFLSLLDDLPPIAFVCIDEVHCISQWSHNFRPAYFQLSKVIREKLKVSTILGLTATAPSAMIDTLSSQLSIDRISGIITGNLLPSNLILSVSKDEKRDEALMKLLNGKRFQHLNSIIVYCTRREDCDRISTLIRTYIRESSPSKCGKNAKYSTISESYHAGLSITRRRTIQKHFMNGKIRIIVATVAFGMGLNKSDIRGVIHYNMPRSLEYYIQEVGRAGRDGLLADCHLFLSPFGSDVNELSRHVYCNSVDRYVIRRLISAVTGSSIHFKASDDCVKVALNIQNLINDLDMPEENLQTLLCCMESHEDQWIRMKGSIYSTGQIKYTDVEKLQKYTEEFQIITMVLEICDDKSSGKISFSILKLMEKANKSYYEVKNELLILQKYTNGDLRVDLSNLSYYIEVRPTLSERDLDLMLTFLYDRVVQQEKKEITNLWGTFHLLLDVAHTSYLECVDTIDKSKHHKLKSYIQDYFFNGKLFVSKCDVKPPDSAKEEEDIVNDIKNLVFQHSDNNWTGRAIARVFQGIGSPNFPVQYWKRNRNFWRLHVDVDFNFLCRIATNALLKLRTLS